MENFGAIILAAGKGTRMNSKEVNKVVLPVAGKPMILHTVNLLEYLDIHTVVIVVGFAKQSVINILGERVLFAIQTKRLGTGHAAYCGLRVLPENIKHVLMMYGDDFSYPREKVKSLMDKHLESGAAMTFLTIEQDNPKGLGRIVRDSNGEVLKIAEEKDATDEERKITEINPGCYVFSTAFLRKYLPKVKKSPVTGEYYLTSLIDMAIQAGEKVETSQAGNIPWRGVNTPDELQEAERLFTERLQYE